MMKQGMRNWRDVCNCSDVTSAWKPSTIKGPRKMNTGWEIDGICVTVLLLRLLPKRSGVFCPETNGQNRPMIREEACNSVLQAHLWEMSVRKPVIQPAGKFVDQFVSQSKVCKRALSATLMKCKGHSRAKHRSFYHKQKSFTVHWRRHMLLIVYGSESFIYFSLI